MFVSKITLVAALALLPTTLGACANSNTFSVTVDGKARNCKWIRFKEERRETYCVDPAVEEACPQTCGTCCEDAADYVFPLKNSSTQTFVDCAWISKNGNKIESRQAEYCQSSVTYQGRSIIDACPVACDECLETVNAPTATPGVPTASPVTSAPSKGPTGTPSSSPIKSGTSAPQDGTPSASPTRPPSPMPSPFPTLAPTSKPSISPSDLPSLSPSDMPSLLPSVSPSDVPSLLPSISPSDLPSLSPSDMPSLLPSVSPSDLPSLSPSDMPSLLPSISPSDVPSVIPSMRPSDVPSVSPSIEPTNNPTKSIKPSAPPTAAPIGEASGSPTGSPSKSPSLKPSASPVASPTSGPSIAPTIDCFDSTTATFVLDNGVTQNCAWLTKNSAASGTRIATYCGRAEVKTECVQSCDFCTCIDDEDFSFELDNGDAQDCAWLTTNFSKKEIRIGKYCAVGFEDVQDACTASCGLC